MTETEEITVIRGGLRPGDVFVREVPVQMGMEPQFLVQREIPTPPKPEPGTFGWGTFEGRRDRGVVNESGDFLFWNRTWDHMQKEPLALIENFLPDTATTWDASVPCPDCGQSRVLGYRMDNEHGAHMHTHYVCTFWASGTPRACGWHGWSVPGWDAELGKEGK